MVDSLYHLIRLLFFDIPLLLLYYYINLRSSIIFCLCYGDAYLSLSISSSLVSQLFCSEVFKTLVILLAILFPMKSPVASAVFWTTLFELVLRASVADCLAWSRSVWLYLLLKFLFMFLPTFLTIISEKETKVHSLLRIFDPLVELNSVSFFIRYT